MFAILKQVLLVFLRILKLHLIYAQRKLDDRIFFSNSSERGGRTCQCNNDTIPMDRERATGLVKGCRKATFEELLSVVSCKKRFTLEQDSEWIPETTIKTHFNGQHYAMSFYINFPKGTTKF